MVAIRNYNVTMPSITVRNLPEELLARIRTLSARERRSMNSELLVLIERGLERRLDDHALPSEISVTTQVGIWELLAGRWSDTRSTPEIVRDIYASRTVGREVESW